MLCMTSFLARMPETAGVRCHEYQSTFDFILRAEEFVSDIVEFNGYIKWVQCA